LVVFGGLRRQTVYNFYFKNEIINKVEKKILKRKKFLNKIKLDQIKKLNCLGIILSSMPYGFSKYNLLPRGHIASCKMHTITRGVAGQGFILIGYVGPPAPASIPSNSRNFKYIFNRNLSSTILILNKKLEKNKRLEDIKRLRNTNPNNLSPDEKRKFIAEILASLVNELTRNLSKKNLNLDKIPPLERTLTISLINISHIKNLYKKKDVMYTINYLSKQKSFKLWKIPILYNYVSESVISYLVELFYMSIVKDIPDGGGISVKIIIVNDKIENNVKSISLMRIFEKDCLAAIIDTFIDYFRLKQDDYQDHKWVEMQFIYKIHDEETILRFKKEKIDIISNENRLFEKNNKKFKTIEKLKIYNFNIPTNIEYSEWGTIIHQTKKLIILRKNNSDITYHIKIAKKFNTIELINKNNTKILVFKDYIISSNQFKRNIKNKNYFFENNKLTVITWEIKLNILKTLDKNAKINEKFLTYDLETRNSIIKGKEIIIPRLACIYHPKYEDSFWTIEYNNDHETIIKKSLEALFKKEWNNFHVGIHNFSKFDGVFIIKIILNIVSYKNVTIFKRNGVYIKFVIKFGKNKIYTLHFRDTFLIYSTSLQKLTSGIDVSKSSFPHDFFNLSHIDEGYIGSLPEFKYYNNQITQKQYDNIVENYKNLNWNLKEELLNYCRLDVKCLWEYCNKDIISVYNNYGLNSLDYSTRPSLAKAIYRKKFYDPKKTPIALIGGKLYNELKKYMAGGDVQVFKNYGKNLYHYDINSLYPYVIKSYAIPIGQPTQFQGDIFKIIKINEFFGFAECLVTAPKNIKHPLLGITYKNTRIFPTGQWKGFYTSYDIQHFSKLGYEFSVLNGYMFEKGYLFTEYVDHFYNIKQHSPKGSVEYQNSKININSLFGSFAINPYKENLIFINESEYDDMCEIHQNCDYEPFMDDIGLFSYLPNYDIDSVTTNININIAISAIITSAAKCEILTYLTIPEIELYYEDTDCVVLNKPLPDNMVGNELGKIKLEFIYKEAVFLTSKVYSGKFDVLDENGVITEKTNTKAKGLTSHVSFDDLKMLLNENEVIKIVNPKIIRDEISGKIILLRDIFTLSATRNKNNLVYEKGILTGSIPFILRYNPNTEINEIVE
jgi:hypothetical protein